MIYNIYILCFFYNNFIYCIYIFIYKYIYIYIYIIYVYICIYIYIYIYINDIIFVIKSDIKV